MTLAYVRPDAWNGPLFLHVLGAFVLVGGIASVAILDLGARRPGVGDALARGALWATLAVVLPGWAVMRAAGQWLKSREHLSGDATWLGIGFTVSDLGLLVVLALGLTGWLGLRRAPVARTVGAAIALVYLAALAAAWWSMAWKPA